MHSDTREKKNGVLGVTRASDPSGSSRTRSSIHNPQKALYLWKRYSTDSHMSRLAPEH